MNGKRIIKLYYPFPSGEEAGGSVEEVTVDHLFKLFKEQIIHELDIEAKAAQKASKMVCDYVSTETARGIAEALYEMNNDTGGLSFSAALQYLKEGKAVRLSHWAPDVVIKAQFPDKHSKMTAPYLYVESHFGRVPWKETMIELFSNDWEVV